MTRFTDQAQIEVFGGNGGDGMVAFRREKFVPDGGPAGGDGGRGGDVILKVDEGESTLIAFRYKRHFKAKKGDNGQSKSMHGRGAEDLYVSVPQGTIVKDAETGAIIGDLTEHGQELVVARGGKGGRGNKRFATPRNPAPEISENGRKGQIRTIDLELRVLADVGLIGYPSVGKSTLLSVVTAAEPKIGNYPFTTLSPNIGVVLLNYDQSFVMADVPGLIEGASEGVGLGLDFLRHISRTKVLIHMIDMSAEEGRDPFEDYENIMHELASYEIDLSTKPMIIVANKMEMPDSADNLEVFKMEYREKYGKEVEIEEISTFTTQGVDELMQMTYEVLQTAPEPEELEITVEDDFIITLEDDESKFTLERNDDGTWVVDGIEIQRLVEVTNFTREEAVHRFSRQLRGLGVDEALREAGARDGDTVSIGGMEMEFAE